VMGELLNAAGQLRNGQGGPTGINPIEALQRMANNGRAGQNLLPAQLGQPQQLQAG
jgi:hypothetical protein